MKKIILPLIIALVMCIIAFCIDSVVFLYITDIISPILLIYAVVNFIKVVKEDRKECE